MRVFAFAAFLLLATVGVFGQVVPPEFLGIHVNHMSSWPLEAPAHLFRTLSSTGGGGGGSMWYQMQTDENTFDFGVMDAAMAATAAQGVAVTFTPVGVPSFVVGHDSNGPIGWSLDGSRRRSCGCAHIYQPDRCYPPGDINPDGSGTDAAWIKFITALASHVHSAHEDNPHGYSDIAYWENGNEWTYNGQQFCGSFAQMARMLTDEKCVVTGKGPGCERQGINPSAKMETIALNGGGDPLDKEYLATLPNIPLAETPAQLADIFNYHCYKFYPNAEGTIGTGMATMRFVANDPYLKGKPVFCTEGGWLPGSRKVKPDTWTHAADFISRYLLGLASTGVQRFILFGYDFYSNMDAPGLLAQLSDNVPTNGCTESTDHGYLCPTGVAWTRIGAWLTDVNFSGPCTSTVSGAGHIWTCSHTSAGGTYKSGQFAWFDVSDETTKYQVPTGFSREENMKGDITRLSRHQSIVLSNSPVLLMDDGAPSPPTNLTAVDH
jgi:hypothetical protein